MENKDKIIIDNLELVRKIANKMDSRDYAVDSDDLYSIGVMGLMDAAEKFDESLGVPFQAYASMRIKGSIIDELRKLGKVSRDQMDKLKEYYGAKDKLQIENSRLPTEKEVIKELGITAKQVARLYESTNILNPQSIDFTNTSDEGEEFSLKEILTDGVTVEGVLIKTVTHELLMNSIDTLDERDKQLLQMHYVDNLNMTDIASILKVSLHRVSQIHKKVLLQLRKIMEEQGVDNAYDTSY